MDCVFCGKDISPSAMECPYCHRDTKESSSAHAAGLGWVVLGVLVGYLINGWLGVTLGVLIAIVGGAAAYAKAQSRACGKPEDARAIIWSGLVVAVAVMGYWLWPDDNGPVDDVALEYSWRVVPGTTLIKTDVSLTNLSDEPIDQVFMECRVTEGGGSKETRMENILNGDIAPGSRQTWTDETLGALLNDDVARVDCKVTKVKNPEERE